MSGDVVLEKWRRLELTDAQREAMNCLLKDANICGVLHPSDDWSDVIEILTAHKKEVLGAAVKISLGDIPDLDIQVDRMSPEAAKTRESAVSVMGKMQGVFDKVMQQMADEFAQELAAKNKRIAELESEVNGPSICDSCGVCGQCGKFVRDGEEHGMDECLARREGPLA